MLKRQKIVSDLARRLVQMSDEAQESIQVAAEQLSSDIKNGLVRGVSKFARDVQQELDRREADKRKKKGEGRK